MAWSAVGARGLDAASLGIELLLPSAVAMGGTCARGMPGTGAREEAVTTTTSYQRLPHSTQDS